MDLNQFTPQQTESPEITLEYQSLLYLDEIRKWAHFLAVLGFVFLGLMVVLGFSFGAIFSALGDEQIPMPFPSFLFGFIYLILAAIYFFPVLYLYRFSVAAKKALKLKSPNEINEAFKNLKSHYKFIGIMMIVMLCLYGLMFIVMAAAGVLTSMI